MKTSAVLCLMALAASASATLRGATYMLEEENNYAPVFLEQFEEMDAYAATYKQPPPPPSSYKKPSKKPAASYSKPSTKPSGKPKPSTGYATTPKKQPYIFVSEDMNDADIGRAVLDAMRDDAESYSPPSQSYNQPPASNYQQPPPSSYNQPPPTYLKPSSPYQQPPSSYQQPPSSYQQPPSSYQQPPPKKKPSYQRPSSYKQPPPTYLKPSSSYQKPSSPYQKPSASYNQPKPSSGEKPCPTHEGANKAPKGKYFVLVSDDAEDTEEVDDIAYDLVADDGDVFLDTWESNADMEARKKKKKKAKKPTKYNLMDQRLRLVALAESDDVTERDLASESVMDDGDYLISINQHAADDDDAMFLADGAPSAGVPNPGFKPEKKKTNYFGNGKAMLTDETYDDIIRDAENVFIASRKRVPHRYYKKAARVLDANDDDDDDTNGLDIEDRRPTHLLTPSSGGAFNGNSGVKTYFLRSVSEDDGDEDVQVNDGEVNGGGDDYEPNYVLPNPWEDTDN